MNKNLFTYCITCIIIFCSGIGITANAAIRLPGIIGDNMVLQRGINVPLWGWAKPGEVIQIGFQGRKFTSTTDKQGEWRVNLKSYKAGGPYTMTLESQETKMKLGNILIGDVWVASGQSNMEFGIQTERSGAEEIAKARDSLIHMFFVPMTSALEPKKDIAPSGPNSRNGKWIVCSAEALADTKWAWHGFSAVGYYFAKEIRKFTGSPIGMIATYKGGTPAQAWISLPGLQQQPSFTNYTAIHQQLVDKYAQAKQEYSEKSEAFQTALKQWDQQKTGPKPVAPASPDGGFNAPSNLFNGMVAPLIRYAIKGVIWYQGESNGDRLEQALEYETLFPRLILDWRQNWKQGDFPFLYVQLTNFRKPSTTPSEGIWPWVREAQFKTLTVPKTGMAIITDIGDADNIHPTNKKDVGIRLALAARKIAYGENLVYSGPVYKSMKITGSTIELQFENKGSALVAYNPSTNQKSSGEGAKLKGFGIAGDDGKFVWAEAVLEGDIIKVSSEKISKPVAVRYNWADNPPGTLYNKEGLPVGPFRTDNFSPKK